MGAFFSTCPRAARGHPALNILDDLPELEDVPYAVPGYEEEVAKLKITCAICLDEMNETIDLPCMHSFCLICLEGQLHARWPGARMTFGYLNCGLCRTPLAHEALEEKLKPHWDLKHRAEEVAVQKFVDDGLLVELQKKLDRPATAEEIVVRATGVMTVLRCAECKEPFCAGKVDCADSDLLVDERLQDARCPACEWTSTAKMGDHRCMVHGYKYAMFKCDSCCSVATWNCYSNHYCERCHRQAHLAKHYPCPGPNKCPLGMPHPPNQEAKHMQDVMASFCIGCTACLGLEELPEHLDFNDKNIFGFPVRPWPDFAHGVDVLTAVGEEEIRARLKVRDPALRAELDSLSAIRCAELLLPLEVEAFSIVDMLRLFEEELREYQNERYQLDEDAWQIHYEQEQDARREYEQEQEQREIEEREAREQKAASESDAWIEMQKEYRLERSVHDRTEFKLLYERSRAKHTICKARRSEHGVGKRDRLPHRYKDDCFGMRLRAHRGYARHQRYQDKGGRRQVQRWDYVDAMESLLLCG